MTQETGIEIVAGSMRDLPDVLDVMERAFDPAFGEAWNAAQCAGVLGLPGVWLMLARRGDAVIGFTLSRHVLDEAELLLIAVDPAHRGIGAGRILLSHTFAEAARLGALRLHLEMRDGNPAAHLYARTGFREIGRRHGYYRGRDGQVFDALTLARNLLQSIGADSFPIQP